MVLQNLGKIKKVDLREVWKNEALDFTNWLAREENLSALGDEIGISIKLNQTEAPVGKFSVDILAEDENTGKKIVIENQLEQTDHNHLGKLITYTSGYDAKIAIWIVKDVRDEHRQAIDWLNEHTDDDANFFLIKMELWSIDNSLPAPKFQIISRPNNWTKSVRKGLSQIAMKELDFLSGFVSYCKEKGSTLKLSQPSSSAPAYYQISTGTSKWTIEIKINTQNNTIKEDVSFKDKDLFYKLRDIYKREIEEGLQHKPIWDEMENFKSAQVGVSESFDIDDMDSWSKHYEWLRVNAEQFRKVFGKYIKKALRTSQNAKKEKEDNK